MRWQAVAGTLHNVINGLLEVDFASSLLDNAELLERVASRNAELNGGLRGALGDRTYLLSQVIHALLCDGQTARLISKRLFGFAVRKVRSTSRQS